MDPIQSHVFSPELVVFRVTLSIDQNDPSAACKIHFIKRLKIRGKKKHIIVFICLYLVFVFFNDLPSHRSY